MLFIFHELVQRPHIFCASGCFFTGSGSCFSSSSGSGSTAILKSTIAPQSPVTNETSAFKCLTMGFGISTTKYLSFPSKLNIKGDCG